MYLGIEPTLPKQDDYFNMGKWPEQHGITQWDMGGVHSLWTDNGTKNEHTCSPAGHKFVVKNQCRLGVDVK